MRDRGITRASMGTKRSRYRVARAMELAPLEPRWLMTTSTFSPVPISATHLVEGNSGTATVLEFVISGAVNAANFTQVAINWGDGSPADTSSGVVTAINGFVETFQVTGTHTYAVNGAYTVSVSMHDTLNNVTRLGTGSVTVDDAPLATGSVLPANTLVGAAFNGSVGAFSDGNPGATAGSFSATINWGDGSSLTAATISGNASAFSVSGTHTYTIAGSYTLTEVVNDNGGSSLTITNTMTVSGDAVIAGTSGNDVLTFALNNTPSSFYDITLNGVTTDLGHLTTVTASGGAGNDILNIDALGNSTPFPALSVPGRFTVAGATPVFYSGFETVNYNDMGAVDNLAGTDTKDRTAALTGLTGNTRYVQTLYLDILGRPGSAPELSFWAGLLGSGTTRSAVISMIDHSAEARTDLVKAWYEQYLGRQAFNGEEQVWVSKLLAGQTEDQVLAGIISSPEYFGRAQQLGSSQPANDRFVRSLFTSLLNRSAADADVAFFDGQITSVGLTATVQQILASTEFKTDVVDAMYGLYLHRRSDSVGLSFFVGSSMNVAGVREAIQASDEFFANG